jgi:amino acid permease
MGALRRGAAVVQRYVVTLYFLGVIVQFFLVGVGLFGMKAGSNIDNAKSLDAHRGFGTILIFVVGGLLLIGTLVAWQRPLGRKVGLYVLLCLLGVVQMVLASAGFHHKWVGMFHPVNALLLLGLSGYLARTSWVAHRAEAPQVAPAAQSG